MSKEYNASNIKVLRGLDPVKKVPGMYTRKKDTTHIVQEVLDNGGDEALAGYAKNITVTLFADGSAQVEDDGRGIPVDIPPDEEVPAVELVFTQLHSGGKFDKEDEDSSYKFSGGLHGVGVSVTNALSTKLEVEVKRDGSRHYMAFADGNVAVPLAVKGSCAKKDTGTRVRCWPDPKYFDSPNVDVKEMTRLVRSKAAFMPGVNFKLMIETSPGVFNEKVWNYSEGISEYLAELVADAVSNLDPEAPVINVSGELFAKENLEGITKDEGASWAVVFYEGAGGSGESYVNLIPTLDGGTHEAGLRTGLYEAVKNFMDHHSLNEKDIKVTAEDVWSNLRFVLSARVLTPQFQGQTKEKLTNREALKLVSFSCKSILENWLNLNVDSGKKIAELANKSAASRNKKMVKIERKKSNGMNIMPAKLSDCHFAGTLQAELFLVEGDSAGGSAKMARNKDTQAILPLRGKVKNTWNDHPDQILGNREIHDIFSALGIDPHQDNAAPDKLANLRYGKINILSDADVDGSHIQVLLLALFLRHAPKLIENGHVYIARPPLYRIDVPSQGKGKPARNLYVSDESEKVKVIRGLVREGISEEKLSIQRFKGLGEMNPEQLWETTLCPDTRRLSKVTFPEGGFDMTTGVFDMLVSSDESADRRAWIERDGHTVEADV